MPGSTLSLANQLLLIDRKNNYPEGTQYSAQYLNQTGSAGFEGLSVFYGAKAQVTSEQMYDANGNMLSGSTQPATVTGDRVLRPAPSYTCLALALLPIRRRSPIQECHGCVWRYICANEQ